MKIALVDVDGHNFPNLALCKIAGFYKREGHSVEWYSPLFSDPDMIFASKVFTFTPDYADYAAKHPEPIKGGTGYDPKREAGFYDLSGICHAEPPNRKFAGIRIFDARMYSALSVVYCPGKGRIYKARFDDRRNRAGPERGCFNG